MVTFGENGHVAKEHLLASEQDQEEQNDNSQSNGMASFDMVKVLGVKGMVGLIFFEVSGGPYGAEPVIRHAGPLLAVLGFILIPFIWSAPIAVMTAEMCSEDPHVGGKIHFVHKMWGPWIGWYNGWFNAVSNLFDVATLPAMALSYAEALFGSFGPQVHWWACLSLLCVAVIANLLGIELVGSSSYLLCIVVCMPVVLLVLLGLPSVTLPAAPEWHMVNGLKFLVTLMWNTSGFDDAGATAAEVKTPCHVYPRALAIALTLVTAMYVVPLGVGSSVDSDARLWHSGFLTQVGGDVGGHWLAVWVSAGGFFSSVAQLNALLCSSVREVVCMAEQPKQPVPKILARVSARYGTPHYGTVVFGLALIPTLKYTFVDLIAATVLFDCVSFIMQFATWIRHRWNIRSVASINSDSTQEEKFRMSIGFTKVVLWSAGPCILCSAVICLSLTSHDVRIGVLVVVVIGEVLYRLQGIIDRS